MGRRLTDLEKKKIISDYVMNSNLRETARINGVAVNTVKNLVKNEEVTRQCTQKEEDNTKDILEYIDTRLNKQKKVIELSLDVLEKKLQKPDAWTNIRDVATVFGIFTDKAFKSKELRLKEKELALKEKSTSDVMNKLDQLLEEQKNA
jgi:hypothetical protein